MHKQQLAVQLYVQAAVPVPSIDWIGILVWCVTLSTLSSMVWQD